MNRRLGLLILCGGLLFTMGCAKGGNKESITSEVVVNTTITPGGQFPDELCVTLKGAFTGECNATDFVMTGQANDWMDSTLHDISATIGAARIEGDQMILSFDSFSDKYFFVVNWNITNDKYPELNVSSSQVTQVVTPVADEFQTFTTETGDTFNYHLYTPENAKEPLPIVIVFHGFADTNNLLTYRTSVAWAEEEAQKKHPCYVLSPIINDSDYFSAEGRKKVYDALMVKIKEMRKEKLIDSSRIYMMGNSFGGMATIEFMEQYPNTVAGAITLCSAMNFSETATQQLELLRNSPIWIAQSENDQTISSEISKETYDTLVHLDNKDVKLTIYTDEEMDAAGASPDPNSSVSYHHVEMAVMEDEAFSDWLFDQVLRKTL